MVRGALKSRTKRRSQVVVPSGETRQRYHNRKHGKATCPTGRALHGTANGLEARTLTKTQRRPSRPYGGVLSSPAMRDVMEERANSAHEGQNTEGLYSVGNVCMKIAGRDAGKLCAITEVIDNQYVKVDGYTRPRKVSIKHLEPTGKNISIKKTSSSKEIIEMLQ